MRRKVTKRPKSPPAPERQIAFKLGLSAENRAAALLLAKGFRIARSPVIVICERIIKFEHPPQFGHRLGVSIDPQIDVRIDFAIVNDEACGILPAVLPARIAPGFERAQQAIGK